MRKRRVLTTVMVAFTVALPVIFYGIRLIYHLGDPARYAPADAPDAVRPRRLEDGHPRRLTGTCSPDRGKETARDDNRHVDRHA